MKIVIIYYKVFSKKRNSIFLVHKVFFKYIKAFILSALITNFLIYKNLVSFYTINIKKILDKKRIRGMREFATGKKEAKDAKGLTTGKKRLVNSENLIIVIYYKY